MARLSRLPGRSIKYFGWAMQRHQLWLTEEYILSREITMLQEEVRRYYYGDIQAIVTSPTRSYVTCNWLAGSLIVFLAACLGLSAFVGSPVAIVLAVVAAVVPLVILLGNLMLGPTCKTTLYTAAAEAPLYSLGRQRSTAKAITSLLPFVEAAQRDTHTQAPPEANPTPSGMAEGPFGQSSGFGGATLGPDPSDQ